MCRDNCHLHQSVLREEYFLLQLQREGLEKDFRVRMPNPMQRRQVGESTLLRNSKDTARKISAANSNISAR